MTAQYDYGLLQAVGDDVFISANVEIRRPQLVRVGKHVAIDSGFYCTVGAQLGDYVHIAPYVTIIGGAQGRFVMGNFTGIAAGCRIVCGSDECLGAGLMGPTIPDQYRDNLIIAPVTVENFATVSTNVVLLPGVTLGEGSVIGACSLVRHSTEPWTIYAGIPARPLKTRPRESMLAAARALGYG
jgi:acetyltransferase-like isoleucine patch superfamily enzyme